MPLARGARFKMLRHRRREVLRGDPLPRPPPTAACHRPAHLQADEHGDAGGQQLAQLLLPHVARAAAAGLHKRVAPQHQVAGDEPVGKVREGAGRLVTACGGGGVVQRRGSGARVWWLLGTARAGGWQDAAAQPPPAAAHASPSRGGSCGRDTACKAVGADVGASTMAARCRRPRSWWRRGAAAAWRAAPAAAGGWGLWPAPRAGAAHLWTAVLFTDAAARAAPAMAAGWEACRWAVANAGAGPSVHAAGN